MAKKDGRRSNTRRSSSSPARRGPSPVTGVATPDDVTLVSTEFYQIIPGRLVTIEVTTGDGQASGTSLLLNGVQIPFQDNAGPQPVGSDLDKNVLNARTVVKDVNPSSNHTSVTYDLRGGAQPKEFPFSIDVSADKGRAHYLITFVFTKEAL